MLTIRTSSQLILNRHRTSFRECASSTGIPASGNGLSQLLGAWVRLVNSESRSSWLSERWRMHMRRVRSANERRQA